MPFRMMQYTGNLYEKYVRENKLNKYEVLLPKRLSRCVSYANYEKKNSYQRLIARNLPYTVFLGAFCHVLQEDAGE